MNADQERRINHAKDSAEEVLKWPAQKHYMCFSKENVSLDKQSISNIVDILFSGVVKEAPSTSDFFLGYYEDIVIKCFFNQQNIIFMDILFHDRNYISGRIGTLQEKNRFEKVNHKKSVQGYFFNTAWYVHLSNGIEDYISKEKFFKILNDSEKKFMLKYIDLW